LVGLFFGTREAAKDEFLSRFIKSGVIASVPAPLRNERRDISTLSVLFLDMRFSFHNRIASLGKLLLRAGSGSVLDC
jgi:hypothetical protein